MSKIIELSANKFSLSARKQRKHTVLRKTHAKLKILLQYSYVCCFVQFRIIYIFYKIWKNDNLFLEILKLIIPFNFLSAKSCDIIESSRNSPFGFKQYKAFSTWIVDTTWFALEDFYMHIWSQHNKNN